MWVALAVAIVAAGTSGARAGSAAASTSMGCHLRVLTASVGAGTYTPQLSDDGSRMAFVSNADPLGANPDGNDELFLLDISTWSLRQATDTPRTISGGLGEIAMDADGGTVAFMFDGDPTGENPDGNSEVFTVDTETLAVTQLTASVAPGFEVGNQTPSISADGTLVAFESDLDLLDPDEGSHNHVYLVDVATGELTQLTDVDGSSNFMRPSLVPDGSQVVFKNLVYVPGQPWFPQLYSVTTDTHVVTKLTDTRNGGYATPRTSADGSIIAFGSNIDTGENPDRNGELFVLDTTTGIITQYTHTTSGDLEGGSGSPAVSADGSLIAFRSDRDHVGTNRDENEEIFQLDRGTGEIRQITYTRGSGNYAPATSADGSLIAYESDNDAGPENPDGNGEIYLASCTPTPDLPDLMLRADQDVTAKGDDIYNHNGVAQTRNVRLAPGQTGTFRVRVENDGTAARTFTVSGSPNLNGYRVRYRANGRDVTKLVKDGRYRLVAVPPGASRFLTMAVTDKPEPTYPASFFITAASAQDPTAQDVVVASIRPRSP